MAKRSQIHRLKSRFADRAKATLPQPLPVGREQRLVRVFVEGYEDVAFWRGIFDHFANPFLRFEISVPMREDLPKGKKILMSMIEQSSPEMILCVDSDFDDLFHNTTAQSREINRAEYMFHTYAYATENYLCYAPSLHNVCVKATKNDTRIFDFEHFMEGYSRAIYPAFLWYAYSAQLSSESIFVLADFRTTVRLGYLEMESSGDGTIEWVRRNVERRVKHLSQEHPEMMENLDQFRESIESRGVTAESCYLYMHGHTLMDNVVMVVLNAVCERLRQMVHARIVASSKQGTALRNEISNYNNTQRSIRDVLLDNENYTSCPLFRRLHEDIELFIRRSIWDMKRKGEISGRSLLQIMRLFDSKK